MPRGRVWRALTNANEFGNWFGVRLEGSFASGVLVRGAIVPTKVDGEVAKAQQPYTGLPFEIIFDGMEPERLFPCAGTAFAIEQGVDYSAEPTTLIVARG